MNSRVFSILRTWIHRVKPPINSEDEGCSCWYFQLLPLHHKRCTVRDSHLPTWHTTLLPELFPCPVDPAPPFLKERPSSHPLSPPKTQSCAEDGVSEGHKKKKKRQFHLFSPIWKRKGQCWSCFLNELRVNKLLRVKWKVSFLDQPSLFQAPHCEIHSNSKEIAREQMQNVNIKTHVL